MNYIINGKEVHPIATIKDCRKNNWDESCDVTYTFMCSVEYTYPTSTSDSMGRRKYTPSTTQNIDVKLSLNYGHETAFLDNAWKNGEYSYIVQVCWDHLFNNWARDVMTSAEMTANRIIANFKYSSDIPEQIEDTIKADIPQSLRTFYIIYLYFKDGSHDKKKSKEAK